MQYHIPVLADEVIAGLNVRQGGLYLDGTLGGGGHSELIMRSGGNVVALDKDIEAIEFATARFAADATLKGRYAIYKSDFKAVKQVLACAGISRLDGAVLDLGISSHQVDDGARGFSYRYDSTLDMRMDRSQTFSAMDVVNEYSEDELARILFAYGEEKFAKRIARAIAASRHVSPITTTGQLADIVKASVPFQKGGHPAKRTFQAIRIEVNGELTGLDEAVKDIVSLLCPGGRICVITFHSLEDRIIKQTFREMATDCICDKSLPVCVCGHKAELKEIGRYKPTATELERNSRSASATLRVAEKRR